MEKKITIKIETKLPRGKMPPPSKVFKDKKKEIIKKWTRNKGNNNNEN